MDSDSIYCYQGKMDLIWIAVANDFQKIRKPKRKANLELQFNRDAISNHFISYEEDFFRNESKKVDTSFSHYDTNWKFFTPEEKLVVIKRNQENDRRIADNIHTECQNKQIITINNHSGKVIWIPTIDGTPVIVLQAKDKNDLWKTIRFVYFNWCGNSYSVSSIPKKSSLNLVTELPEKGSYKTKLRFKMFVEQDFIYSNPIDAHIDYCNFLENKGVSPNCRSCKPESHNTLEDRPNHWGDDY